MMVTTTWWGIWTVLAGGFWIGLMFGWLVIPR